MSQCLFTLAADRTIIPFSVSVLGCLALLSDTTKDYSKYIIFVLKFCSCIANYYGIDLWNICTDLHFRCHHTFLSAAVLHAIGSNSQSRVITSGGCDFKCIALESRKFIVWFMTPHRGKAFPCNFYAYFKQKLQIDNNAQKHSCKKVVAI